MTVVTVVAIAAVAAFFYAFVWPSIKTSITASTQCASAQCSNCTSSGNSTKCTACYYGENFESGPITCTFQNGEQQN